MNRQEERRKIEIHRPDYGRDKSSFKDANNSWGYKW